MIESKQVRILILEDSLEDVLLMKRALKEGGINFESRVVENEIDFTRALKNYYPDLILSDYALPGFSGLAAMLLKDQYNHLIPFIFVTGTVKEELAGETILSGAYGYVLKSSLEKLPEIVKDAVANSKVSSNFSIHKEATKWHRQNEVTKMLLSEVTSYLEATSKNNSSTAYIENIEKHIDFLKSFNKENTEEE